MTRVKTSFAGLELRCPVIVGSCGLTASVPNLLEFEQAGAGAVVLKSLFEESIVREMDGMGDLGDHPEAYDYVVYSVGSKMITDYLDLIRAAKAAIHIPVIASIACHSDGKWIEYAREVEKAGADALELNVMSLSTDKHAKPGDFEQVHVKIVQRVCSTVSIPVIVKLGANLSNPVALADALYAHGAKGVVLFNRFYPTDIDVERLEYALKNPLTTPADISQPIRWAGILSAAVPQLPLAVSGGVHDWKGIAKAVLCGASAVEVASAIIQGGAQWIKDAVSGLADWQSRKGFASLEAYRGRMNASDPAHADRLMRVQFLKYFGGMH